MSPSNKKNVKVTEPHAAPTIVTEVETETVKTVQPTTVHQSIESKFDELVLQCEDDRLRAKNRIAAIKALKKDYQRQIRDIAKTKRRRSSPTVRAASGFAASGSCKISDELCNFLGVESGSSLARTTVTKDIVSYIKKQNLEDATNRRVIHPDAALENLVGNSEVRRQITKERYNRKCNDHKSRPDKVRFPDDKSVTDELNYFNLQTHLSRHFLPRAKVVEEVVANNIVMSTA